MEFETYYCRPRASPGIQSWRDEIIWRPHQAVGTSVLALSQHLKERGKMDDLRHGASRTSGLHLLGFISRFWLQKKKKKKGWSASRSVTKFLVSTCSAYPAGFGCKKKCIIYVTERHELSGLYLCGLFSRWKKKNTKTDDLRHGASRAFCPLSFWLFSRS